MVRNKPLLPRWRVFLHRRAQQEILGLVIIVLIFVVALSFVLFFTLRNKAPDFLRDFDEELHGQNTVSALLATTHPECNDLSTKDILDQCVWTDVWRGSACASSGVRRSPCEYATYRIKGILDRALYEMNFEYRFRVYTEDDIVAGVVETSKIDFKSAVGSCASDLTGEPIPQNYKGGTYFVLLNICEPLS